MSLCIHLKYRYSALVNMTTLIVISHKGTKLDWSLYTCLTQLYGGIDMYNLLHKDQLHVSALFIGHLQVDK